MRNKSIKKTIVLSLVASLGLANLGFAAEATAEKADGKALAFDRSKGNCLACHAIPGEPKAESPGNIGPPLTNMKARYSREILRGRISDETAVNADTVMPPYGANKILTEEELDLVTDYIYSL